MYCSYTYIEGILGWFSSSLSTLRLGTTKTRFEYQPKDFGGCCWNIAASRATRSCFAYWTRVIIWGGCKMDEIQVGNVIRLIPSSREKENDKKKYKTWNFASTQRTTGAAQMGRGVGNYSVVSCSFGGGRETIRHIERSWRSNWLWVSFWGALRSTQLLQQRKQQQQPNNNKKGS